MEQHLNVSPEQPAGQAYIRPRHENEERLAKIQIVREITKGGFLSRAEIDKAHFQ